MSFSLLILQSEVLGFIPNKNDKWKVFADINPFKSSRKWSYKQLYKLARFSLPLPPSCHTEETLIRIVSFTILSFYTISVVINSTSFSLSVC